MSINRRIILRAHPGGTPVPSDFQRIEQPVPEPGPGEMRVRNLYFSMEPAIRGWLDGKDNYFQAIPLGGVIRGPTLGVVEISNLEGFRPGDHVWGLNLWEDYSILSAETILLEKLAVDPAVPLSHYVGALGPSGLTAYVGLHDVGQVKAGDTVVISAAAGAVGSVAGQIARLRGARVVGLAGSAEKVALLKDRLGFDAAIDYRAVPDLGAAIADACPDGIDIYFDNVGGRTLDAMLPHMRDFGRVVCCGMIGDYNNQSNPTPVHNLWQVVAKQLTLRGFLLFSHMETLPQAREDLRRWAAEGRLVALENVTRGIDRAPESFCRLMAGQTVGKTVLEVDWA
ncbi:NADP-dependent oxidoreductase [Niveispirillum fermenti]|uniref:NADP-dependent oxidoreductase n=1 Tax=Niveispirillum fermenti TaxID=1233113 RepID=UPI003A8AE755